MSTTKKNKKKETSDGKETNVYVLRLFITGSTALSMKAVRNLKIYCDKYLEGDYDLEIIDIYQQPRAAGSEQILAAPTLLKQSPWPLQRFVGDLSDEENLTKHLPRLSIKSNTPPVHPRKPKRR